MGWEQVGRGSTHGSRCTYRWGQTCNMGCGRKLGPRVVERGTRQGSKMLQGTWGGVPPGNTAAQGRAWNMGMKGRARLGAHTTWPSGRAGMFSRLVLACGARAAAHLQVGGSGACLLLPRGVQGRAGRLCPGSRAAGVQRSPSRAAAKVLAAALGHGAGAVRGGKAGKGKAAGRGGTKAALWPAGCNHTQHQPCHPPCSGVLHSRSAHPILNRTHTLTGMPNRLCRCAASCAPPPAHAAGRQVGWGPLG